MIKRKYKQDNFDAGWLPDYPEDGIPQNGARLLENFDVRNNKLVAMFGSSSYLSGLPTGLVIVSAEKFEFTQPSSQTVTLVHATDSNDSDRHELWIRPYIDSSGSWVDEWLELTEIIGPLTADASTDTTNIYDAALASYEDDYLNQFIVWNATQKRSTWVTDFAMSGGHLTLAHTIASQASGDTYYLYRNPVWWISTDGDTIQYLFDAPNGCEFHFKENIIRICTGNDNSPLSDETANVRHDLILRVMDEHQAFNDSDTAFTGFYLTRKDVAPVVPIFHRSLASAISFQTLIGLGFTEGLEADHYIVIPVALYDGQEESPLWAGDVEDVDGTKYADGGIGACVVAVTENQGITITVTMYVRKVANDQVPFTSYPDKGWHEKTAGLSDKYAYDEGDIVWPRRIEKLIYYMAQADEHEDGWYYPTSEWRNVKEISIDSDQWTKVSGDRYTVTLKIDDGDWFTGAGVDISDRQGHGDVFTFGNAAFIESIRGQVVYAKLNTIKSLPNYIVVTPINSTGLNTSDILPHNGDVIDLSVHGISQIIGFKKVGDWGVGFTKNQVFRISLDTLSPDDLFIERGPVSRNAILSHNNQIFFASTEDIYSYNPRHDVIRSIATGHIREKWRTDVNDSDKDNAAMGYDRRLNMLVIAAGTTVYTYNMSKPISDSYAGDLSSPSVWNVYSIGDNIVRFFTDPDGVCVGITSSGSTVQLFDGSTSLTAKYQSGIIQGPFIIDTIRLIYKATATVNLRLYDMYRSQSYPILELPFPAQSEVQPYDHYRGAQIERLMFELTAVSGAEINSIILNPQQLDED